jgi:Zn-dependent protease with chaperone function
MALFECPAWLGTRQRTPSRLREDVERLRSDRRTLRAIRFCGWIVLLVEAAVLTECWYAALIREGRWISYFASLATVFAWFHGLPLLERWFTKVEAEVSASGNRWRIGKYSEAELRSLFEEAMADLPPRLRRARVCITEHRAVAAWTWLAVFRPSAVWNKPVVLTSGSLHYLERDELMAVLLHEIAHHVRGNRVAVYGGWALADVVFHGVAFWAYCQTASSNVAVATFILLRFFACAIAARVAGDVVRSVEHFCDLFAAERIGAVPMINALLKLAEDEELSEVVLVWVAREMIHEKALAMDDLILAFAKARPYGRIFHENLFRHAAEVTKVLVADRKRPLAKPGTPPKENAELKEFVSRRRRRDLQRIRWRRFDRDGDGVLTADEIARLCEALETRPDHVLVTSQDEYEPTTHPRCRNRILLLHHAGHPRAESADACDVRPRSDTAAPTLVAEK